MIEARDNLYMYVYNHHVAVFSEFMYSYIFRRLDHNSSELEELLQTLVPEGAGLKIDKPISKLGVVPKSYLCSDSDMISLLRNIHYELKEWAEPFDSQEETTQKLEPHLNDEVSIFLRGKGITSPPPISLEEKMRLHNNSIRVFRLIDKYNQRTYLKPWWKTNFEFSDFIRHNFRDERIRQTLCTWVCQSGGQQPTGDEVRSQLAKHVIYITHNIHENKALRENLGLQEDLEDLEDGEFFVIEKAPRFYEPSDIRKLDIVLKNSVILGGRGVAEPHVMEYYVKELNQLIPQRDYYEIYPKEGFYVFSKPLGKKCTSSSERNRHNQLIEQIFIFVADWLVRGGEEEFQRKFVEGNPSDLLQKEEASKDAALRAFKESMGI